MNINYLSNSVEDQEKFKIKIPVFRLLSSVKNFPNKLSNK